MADVRWLDARGRRRGGQQQEINLFPNQSMTVRSPTNDSQVTSFRLELRPRVPAGAASSDEDKNTLSIFASSAGQSETGYVSVFISDPTGEPVSFAFVIAEGNCGRFKFSPGGRCDTP